MSILSPTANPTAFPALAASPWLNCLKMKEARILCGMRRLSLAVARLLGSPVSESAHADFGNPIRYQLVMKVVEVLDASGHISFRHVQAGSPTQELQQVRPGNYP